MKKDPRKGQPKEFKEEAIGLVLNQGYKIAEAARSIGISSQNLGRWVKEYKEKDSQAFPGNGQLSEDQKNIRDLKAKVKRLEMEKDILKKATAFFVKESS